MYIQIQSYLKNVMRTKIEIENQKNVFRYSFKCFKLPFFYELDNVNGKIIG